MMRFGTRLLPGLGLLALAGCDSDPSNLNKLPGFVLSVVSVTHYDGVSNDLLTAGLGAEGLASATAPGYVDPANPTVEELRTNAIHGNYRALVDTTEAGGFGRFYGPTVDPATAVLPRGLIPGTETIALTESGGQRVTVMVQVPDTFDPADPCIVTAPSSGSRGVYGAIGTAGEWGLKRGCAVAYTDKGTGTGFHYLQDDTVNRVRGPRQAAGEPDSNFTAPLDEAARADFNAATPFRFAAEHAHSKQNPEADWGRYVLDSIEFAFYVLNEQFGAQDSAGRHRKTLTPDNTLVIASSVSNGGGASLRALEQDSRGLIDGAAVSEPNVNPVPGGAFSLQQGAGPLLGPDTHSRSLLDYYTLLNLYQPCATLAPANAGAPLNLTPAANAEARCASLRDKGLLGADTLEAQALEAQAIINGYGFNTEQNILQPSHVALQVPQGISALYAMAYGRFGVEDHLCGYSYGAVDAAFMPTPIAPATEAVLFATSNGIPPSGGVNLINNDSATGPVDHRAAISPSTGRADLSLDAALCLREQAASDRVLAGIAEIHATGQLRGKPVLIVTGRDDAVLPVNHTSRPYYALTQQAQGQVHYYEVKHAQHLDVLNGLPGFNERYIPLHVYFNRALDLLYAHLKTGAPLPPSQVIQTRPRGAGAPPLAAANVPAIAADPAAADRIVLDDGVLRIPE